MDTAILIVYKSRESKEVEFVMVGEREYVVDYFKNYIGRATISEYKIGDKFKV